MALLLLALLAGFALATGIVLADSGLRMWSAFGALGAENAMLTRAGIGTATSTARNRPVARVNTRVSYARPAPERMRAAA